MSSPEGTARDMESGAVRPERLHRHHPEEGVPAVTDSVPRLSCSLPGTAAGGTDPLGPSRDRELCAVPIRPGTPRTPPTPRTSGASPASPAEARPIAERARTAGRALHTDQPRSRTAIPFEVMATPLRGASRRRPRRLPGLSPASGSRASLTLTVTEAGLLTGGRRPPRTVAGRMSRPTSRPSRRRPRGPGDHRFPARLVAGLLARRSADAGPLTLLSCDNLPRERRGHPDRGPRPHRAPSIGPWWAGSTTPVDFATSMVDRITPRTTDR